MSGKVCSVLARPGHFSKDLIYVLLELREMLVGGTTVRGVEVEVGDGRGVDEILPGEHTLQRQSQLSTDP